MKLIIRRNNTTGCRFLTKNWSPKKTFEILCVANYNKSIKICSVGSIVSQRPSRFDALCPHYWFIPTPVVGSSFYGLQFCLTPAAVTNLCGSASNFVFLSELLKIISPGPRCIARIWGFVFVSEFRQRYMCLCQLSMEFSFNSMSVIQCAGYILFDSTDQLSVTLMFLSIINN